VEVFHGGIESLASHHGQREEALSQLAIIEQHLMTNPGRFVGRLKLTTQPDGQSLLDTTQVLFGSGPGSGSRHSNTNLPLILAEQSPERIRTAVEGILCSPRFIYLKETDDTLDGYAIASRLSYFPWNTMPDDKLLRDAARGTLRNEKVLAAHVDRMLQNKQSDEFAQSFVRAWLKLQNTVEMAPDPMKFYEFHRNRPGDAMVTETTAFFRQLLTENLPISNFIDSDFAIINADPGRHYGNSNAVNTTAGFQKVAITETRHRGGLPGQTSRHTPGQRVVLHRFIRGMMAALPLGFCPSPVNVTHVLVEVACLSSRAGWYQSSWW
jgi:hypothetical protein